MAGKEKKGKKERKPRRSSKLYSLYKVAGDKFGSRPPKLPKMWQGCYYGSP